MFALIEEFLNKNIEVQYDWGLPVLKRDEESWIEDTVQAFNTLTVEEVLTALKWCNFKGTDEEVIMAAIKSLILPEDLPLNCDCNISFVKET
jgi:hypothetical protein